MVGSIYKPTLRRKTDRCVARDGGIPKFFHHVDKRFRSPVRTIWLAVTLAFILALPSLGSTVAFAAATSIATIGLYVSYGIPILVGLIYHRQFVKGASGAASVNTLYYTANANESFRPIQSWRFLTTGSSDRMSLDRLHHDRLLFAELEPCHIPNSQLYTRCSGNRLHMDFR